MYTFLILSSLGMVFYLVLLIALYRDGRRRKGSDGTVWKMELGTEPSQPLSNGVGRTSSGDVLWVPVTRHYWKPESPRAGSRREKLVYLAEPISTKDDRPIRLKNR